MKRRDFLALTAAAPFVGIGRSIPVIEPPLLLPHRMYLPGCSWSALALVGQINQRFIYYDGRVTAHEGKRLSAAINDEWKELPKWFSLCLGIENNPVAEHWLTGEGWEQRVRIAEAYFRNGGFVVDLHGDGVLLRREEASDG